MFAWSGEPGCAPGYHGAFSDAEQVPGSLDTAQLMDSAVLEAEARAHHQVPDGAGNQDLVRRRFRGDPGGHVHRQPTKLVADPLTFSRVDTSPDA